MGRFVKQEFRKEPEQMKKTTRFGAMASLALLVASVGSTPAAAQSQPEPAIPSGDDAPVAMLVDITSGQILHSRNPDRRFVPASVTKAMTMYTAFEAIDEGLLNAGQVMRVRPESWQEWAGKGSTMWLNARDNVLVADLLAGIANVSANDGSIVLAEGHAGSVAEWTDLMNARAREIGMANSHFNTPNGWPDEGQTFTSARDLVTLAEAMLRRHPLKYARYIGRVSFRYGGIEQYNHDPLIRRTPGADGIKTGYTREAGFNYLGTVKRDGQRLVMVIAGSPRGSVRDRAARRYIEWGFETFDRRSLFRRGETIGQARIQDGEVRNVDLVSQLPVAVNVPRDRMDEISMSVAYDGPLRAPVKEGAQVARLVVEIPGMDNAEFPLVTAAKVEEAGIFARILNGIVGWLS